MNLSDEARIAVHGCKYRGEKASCQKRQNKTTKKKETLQLWTSAVLKNPERQNKLSTVPSNGLLTLTFDLSEQFQGKNNLVIMTTNDTN